MRHVGGKAEEREDDEAGVRVLLDKEIANDLEGIDPGKSRACLCGKDRVAEENGKVEKHDAGEKEHDLGVVVLGNGPAGKHKSDDAENCFEHGDGYPL